MCIDGEAARGRGRVPLRIGSAYGLMRRLAEAISSASSRALSSLPRLQAFALFRGFSSGRDDSAWAGRCDVPHDRVLEVRQQLDERLAQGRHDVGRVVDGQAPDDGDGELADRKDLVVQRNEERAHVLGLAQVVVKAGIEGPKDSLTNGRFWWRDA